MPVPSCPLHGCHGWDEAPATLVGDLVEACWPRVVSWLVWYLVEAFWPRLVGNWFLLLTLETETGSRFLSLEEICKDLVSR